MTMTMTMTMAARSDADTDAHGDEGSQQQRHHQPLAILICSANIGNAEPTRESFGAWIPNDGRYVVDGGGCGGDCGGGASASASTSGSNANADGDDDGDTETGKGRCCIVDDDDADEDNTKQKQKFDIIVIGMQEAAFLHDNSNNNTSEHEDGNNTKSSKHDVAAPDENDDDNAVKVSRDVMDEGNVIAEGALDCVETTTCGVLLDMVNDGVSELRKGSEKSGRRVVQNIGRGNLFMRGLGISSPKLPLPRTMIKTPTVRELQNPFITQTKPLAEDDATTPTNNNSNNHTAATTTTTTASTWSLSYGTKKLHELIANRLPSYEIITSNLRGQMRLYVLALKSLVKEIDDVRVAGENTGLGSVLANKGGTIATMTIRGTRLSFMNAHLAAHEGATNYANRNRSLYQILAGAKTDPCYNAQDASMISHHMFICGDLNYRINFDLADNRTAFVYGDGEKPSYGNTASNGRHFVKAKELIDAEDWKSLAAGDELSMALRRKDCLVGFTTLPCNFPPTFKLARCEGYQYKEARTPSYTDRILWKSADGLADNVEPLLYEPCPSFITSDHKPIRGGYLVKTISGNSLNQTPLLKTHTATHRCHDRKVHLLISDIQCTGLPVMDSLAIGGLCDPYIQFISYPKSLLYNTKKKTWPSTKVIKRTLNPVWEEVVHVSLDQDLCNNTKGSVENDLAGSMLYLTVMDDDYSLDNEVVGTVALNLADLCSNLHTPGPFAVQRTEIKRPILRNGQEFGMLECTISSAYCSSKEDKAFVNSAKRAKSRGMNPLLQAIRKVYSFD